MSLFKKKTFIAFLWFFTFFIVMTINFTDNKPDTLLYVPIYLSEKSTQKLQFKVCRSSDYWMVINKDKVYTPYVENNRNDEMDVLENTHITWKITNTDTQEIVSSGDELAKDSRSTIGRTHTIGGILSKLHLRPGNYSLEFSLTPPTEVKPGNYHIVIFESPTTMEWKVLYAFLTTSLLFVTAFLAVTSTIYALWLAGKSKYFKIKASRKEG